jgi:hypothetical protein
VDELREHFTTHGWVRVPGAFPPADAAAMREATWEALAAGGMRRDDPSTWSTSRPTHLQRLKRHPAFRAVGTPAVLDAIAGVLPGEVAGGLPPADWGAFFLVFPDRTERPWGVAAEGWHVDAPYDDPLDPPAGVKVHAMFGDVPARTGGAMQVVSGSHRLLARWFARHPPRAGARSASSRRAVLAGEPYLRDLCRAGPDDPAARVERFHDRVEEVDGVPLQVRENTAAAGDVFLMHPLLLHAPPPAHPGSAPRFLLNKDLRRAG